MTKLNTKIVQRSTVSLVNLSDALHTCNKRFSIDSRSTHKHTHTHNTFFAPTAKKIQGRFLQEFKAIFRPLIQKIFQRIVQGLRMGTVCLLSQGPFEDIVRSCSCLHTSFQWHCKGHVQRCTGLMDQRSLLHVLTHISTNYMHRIMVYYHAGAQADGFFGKRLQTCVVSVPLPNFRIDTARKKIKIWAKGTNSNTNLPRTEIKNSFPIPLTGQFTDKPTHGQSSRKLVKLWTGQLVDYSTHWNVW